MCTGPSAATQGWRVFPGAFRSCFLATLHGKGTSVPCFESVCAHSPLRSLKSPYLLRRYDLNGEWRPRQWAIKTTGKSAFILRFGTRIGQSVCFPLQGVAKLYKGCSTVGRADAADVFFCCAFTLQQVLNMFCIISWFNFLSSQWNRHYVLFFFFFSS